MKPILVALKSLLEEDNGFSKKGIVKALKRFNCERDKDVQSFLRDKAINREKVGSSRTFLVIDDNRRANNELVIIAYMTLALTSTDCSSLSVDDRKELYGNIPGVAHQSFFSGFLLAQIGRDDAYTHKDYSCGALVSTAEQFINEVQDFIGGAVIYLDCKEELIRYYENYGYKVLIPPNQADTYDTENVNVDINLNVNATTDVIVDVNVNVSNKEIDTTTAFHISNGENAKSHSNSDSLFKMVKKII